MHPHPTHAALQPKPTAGSATTKANPGPANLAPRLAPTNALVQIRSGQSQLCPNPEQARTKHSARFPAGNGGHSRGKICAFSGVCPAHLDGGWGGKRAENQPLANPGLTTKRRRHTTLRLTETLPGPACFQPQNCVLIQTLSCLSGKRIARHAVVIANPDITPSALERLPITSPLVNSRYYSHGPNTLPRNLTTLASSTQLHRACKLQIATTSTT